MTLVDLIKLGIIETNAMAEEFAARLVECWRDNRIPGEIQEILGLSEREYQAWNTGGVSLLTIARWQQHCHPPLDVSRPWFKLKGKPPMEVVGYQEDRRRSKGKRKP
ncbi:MAG TPA: hypothetical protein VE988_17650 [Gemmataceae bacterium]|nr:hypothetical protein [Gemmataceae bacterium]